MKVSKSPLQLLSFNIIRTQYEYFPPNEDLDINKLEDIFDEYEIDIDYAIRKANEQIIAIFAKIYINIGDTVKIGHSIFVESITTFGIDDGLTESDAKSLITVSGVSIAFNNLRGYISNLTSQSPTGSYLFPTFDIIALINAKKAAFEKSKKPTDSNQKQGNKPKKVTKKSTSAKKGVKKNR